MASFLNQDEIWPKNRNTFPAVDHQAPSSSSRLAAYHDARFYASCYIAGGLSSSIRWILSPLELVKTRQQTISNVVVPPSSHGNVAASVSLQTVYAQHGTAGLFRGVGPTAVAYWFQTSTKYGLYEVLKDRFTMACMEVTGQPETIVKQQYGGAIYVAAAGTAEAVADVLMCPFEMVRVRVQTDPNMPNTLLPAIRLMMSQRQKLNFPFGSLGPLWGRQIPGTIANFYTFESTANFIYEQLLSKSKEEYSSLQQLGVTVCAGYTAGFCSTIVSHPADSILSLQSVPKYHGLSVWQIARSVGFYKLATRGLLRRMLLTGQIISVQWLLYDTAKSVMGLSTSGGGSSNSS